MLNEAGNFLETGTNQYSWPYPTHVSEGGNWPGAVDLGRHVTGWSGGRWPDTLKILSRSWLNFYGSTYYEWVFVISPIAPQQIQDGRRRPSLIS